MRPKPQDLPGVEGEGVSPFKDKKLEALADKFSDLKTQRGKVSSDMTKVEKDIIERMIELKVDKFTYSDREVKIKYGKHHVNIKTVEVEGQDGDKD